MNKEFWITDKTGEIVKGDRYEILDPVDSYFKDMIVENNLGFTIGNKYKILDESTTRTDKFGSILYYTVRNDNGKLYKLASQFFITETTDLWERYLPVIQDDCDAFQPIIGDNLLAKCDRKEPATAKELLEDLNVKFDLLLLNSNEDFEGFIEVINEKLDANHQEMIKCLQKIHKEIRKWRKKSGK